MKKKIVAFGIFILLCGGIYGYNRLTEGFNVREIRSSLTDDPMNAQESLSDEQRKNMQQLLDQPFRYIGKGCQFYAFESKDGQYVIKFFKHKHLRPLHWLRSLPAPTFAKVHFDKKIEEREKRTRNLFSSCRLAFQSLAEETGVVYLHLNRIPDLYQYLVLIDKAGFKHNIYLDEYDFVLQKKAFRANTTLSNLLHATKEEELRSKIHQLAEIVTQRCEKGIRDRDRSFVQNVAFCANEDRAVFVDIGQFFVDESVKAPEEKRKDLLRRLNILRFWAEEKNPALIPYVDDEIAKY